MQADPEAPGTVVVRDVISRGVVARFRAHTSLLGSLSFSPDGTALATASVRGHTVNVFRVRVLAPGAPGGGPASQPLAVVGPGPSRDHRSEQSFDTGPSSTV